MPTRPSCNAVMVRPAACLWAGRRAFAKKDTSGQAQASHHALEAGRLEGEFREVWRNASCHIDRDLFQRTRGMP